MYIIYVDFHLGTYNYVNEFCMYLIQYNNVIYSDTNSIDYLNILFTIPHANVALNMELVILATHAPHKAGLSSDGDKYNFSTGNPTRDLPLAS